MAVPHPVRKAIQGYPALAIVSHANATQATAQAQLTTQQCVGLLALHRERGTGACLPVRQANACFMGRCRFCNGHQARPCSYIQQVEACEQAVDNCRTQRPLARLRICREQGFVYIQGHLGHTRAEQHQRYWPAQRNEPAEDPYECRQITAEHCLAQACVVPHQLRIAAHLGARLLGNVGEKVTFERTLEKLECDQCRLIRAAVSDALQMYLDQLSPDAIVRVAVHACDKAV
ncbi:hypothetical protein D3C80_1240810 [compost metagenome]